MYAYLALLTDHCILTLLGACVAALLGVLRLRAQVADLGERYDQSVRGEGA